MSENDTENEAAPTEDEQQEGLPEPVTHQLEGTIEVPVDPPGAED